MKNLDAYFTQQLGIPVAIGNPLARLPLKAPKLPPDYIGANGPALSVALGLALRDMI
jgi:Tfp pilus assembly PilM family ATPase